MLSRLRTSILSSYLKTKTFYIEHRERIERTLTYTGAVIALVFAAIIVLKVIKVLDAMLVRYS